MSRKRLLSLVIPIMVVLLSATTIWAGTYRTPDKDTACDVGGTCWNDSGIYLDTSGQISGGCSTTPNWVGYVDWDLTSENRTWNSASLKLTAYRYSGGTQPYTFKLYAVSDTSWTESNSQTDPGYDANTVLGTATVDLTATNGVVEFKDDNNNTLGTYFSSKKGGQASIAVALTGGCGSAGSVIVQFEDREGHGGSAPTSANEPDLVFWTGSGATAVSLSSVGAETGVNWLLIAGLFALAAMAVVGIGYGVRRSKQS